MSDSEDNDMSKRNLLLCFDAFGTLFTPKRPIAQQYGEVARSLGLGPFTDDQVQTSFKTAFKKESNENPNFGKANGMNASRWWTNIIHNTFRPLVSPDTKLHDDLAPRLLYRFSSEEAYELLPGALRLLQNIRNNRPQGFERIAVGVVTNSDDRVPSVLTSLGLRMSPLKYGSELVITTPPPNEQYEVDFTVMSYDVGHEKPDKRIFTAAEELLAALPAAAGTELSSWDKVYVGDEYDKDVVGARGAGWHAVLLQANASSVPTDLHKLDEQEPGNLLQLIRKRQTAAACSDFGDLAVALGLQTDMTHL